MIQAYFFDLDGTLVDTEILWVEALELLAREHGYVLSHEESLEMVYGIAWPEVYENFTRRFPELDCGVDKMGERLAPHFQQLRDSSDVRIHTSIQLLLRLAESHPVAVVSGSYRVDVEAGIDLAHVRSAIRFSLGHEDYSPGKPHPACYLTAAAKMGVQPKNCVVFEDSNAGLTAAKDAGMYGVALARPDRPAQDHSRADLILDDLAGFDPAHLTR